MRDAPVRVRFAPSPTGYLHVGGARTALFNWLYARHSGGTFILRIEDTDIERSSSEMVDAILRSLRWLDLDWDEGPDVGGPHEPYLQSGRLDRYRARAAALVASGHAYYCFCDPATLQARRDAAQKAGEEGKYDRTCLNLSDAERAALAAAGRPRAIRFRVPDGTTTFHDLVHGPIEFDHAHIEDFVVLRSDGHPTYHLTVVDDDIDMAVTHVVRGDDHISNTPKQLMLYGAFGAPPPAFAHVPLILGPDKRRLSKRHGATSVTEYIERGVLPEAMVNFLALLGWSPGTDEEVFSREELIARFSIEGISTSNAVFNPEKLEWFNGQHLARLPADELERRLEPLMRRAGLWRESFGTTERAWLGDVLTLMKPRARTLGELVEGSRFFFEPPRCDPEAVARYLPEAVRPHVEALAGELDRAEPFDKANIEATLRRLAEARSVKAAVLIHATRVAVTGRAVSPGLFEVLELLGRSRVVTRLRQAPAHGPSRMAEEAESIDGQH